MKIAGHSGITISQRYVHPTPEHVERMFERFEAYRSPAKVPTLPPAKTEPITVLADISTVQ